MAPKLKKALFVLSLTLMAGCTTVQQIVDQKVQAGGGTPNQPAAQAATAAPSQSAPPAASASATVPTDADLKAVMEESARAFNNQDINAYMATIHEDSPFRDRERQATLAMFNSGLNVKVALQDINVLSKSETEAKLSLTQIFTSFGSPFGRQEAHYVLKPSSGKWKVYTSEVKNQTGGAQQFPSECFDCSF